MALEQFSASVSASQLLWASLLQLLSQMGVSADGDDCCTNERRANQTARTEESGLSRSFLFHGQKLWALRRGRTRSRSWRRSRCKRGRSCGCRRRSRSCCRGRRCCCRSRWCRCWCWARLKLDQFDAPAVPKLVGVDCLCSADHILTVCSYIHGKG